MIRAMPVAPALPPPVFDAAAAYPAMAAVQAALRGRDWAGLRAVVDAEPDPAGRTMLIGEGAETPGAEPFLREVLARDPDDGVAAAMLGGHLIRTGWEARTAARAEHGSRNADWAGCTAAPTPSSGRCPARCTSAWRAATSASSPAPRAAAS